MTAALVPHLDLFHTAHQPGREAAFLVLLAFLLSFGFIRTSARLTRSVSWWPGGVETSGGLHIHHLVWGIVLLLLSGFVAFATEMTSPWWQLTAVGFGIGAGFTLDEFALWLRLEDVYWANDGRASVDAVILAAVFGGLVVVGVVPYGLDDTGSITGTALTGIGCFGLAACAFLKGRIFLGMLGLFVPLFSLWALLRLGKPGSPWAKWRYTGHRAGCEERARHRFADDRLGARVGRRVLDAIGGAPSRSDAVAAAPPAVDEQPVRRAGRTPG